MSNFTINGGINFDASQVRKGLKSGEASAEQFSNKMAKIGGRLGTAFAVASVAKFAKGQIDLANQLAKDARKVNTSTTAYQTWLDTVENTGGNMSNALGALGDLQMRQSEAINGNASAAKAFEELGISIDQVANSSMEELLDAVAKGMVATGNLAAAGRVLGQDNLRGVNIALKEVANGGFQELIDQAEKAGKVFSDDFTREASEFSDYWRDFGNKFKKVFANNIISPLLQLPEAAKAAWQATKDVFTGDIALAGWANRAGKIMGDLNAAQDEAEATVSTVNDRLQAVIDSNKSKPGEAGKAAGTAAAGREYSSLRRIGANIVGGAAVKDRIQESMKKAAEEQVNIQKEIRDNTANLDQLGGRF
jgi:hypothetical protein